MTKVITYFSQKGGCGKTTLSALTASYLAYTKRKRVVVIDGDQQGSFVDMRDTEKKSGIDNSGLGIEEYPIYSCKEYSKLPAYIRKLRDKGDCDFLIVDLPGQISDPNIIVALSLCNYIIFPMEHVQNAFSSGLRSIKAVYELMLALRKSSQECHIEHLAAVMNKVPRTQLGLANNLKNLVLVNFHLEKIFGAIIGRVDNMTSDRVSTLLPPSEVTLAQKGLNYKAYLDELSEYLGV